MARWLRPKPGATELLDLHRAKRAEGPPPRTPVEVDLRALSARVRQLRPARGIRYLVGHLSHRLPVQGVVVLRCHPRELRRRLRPRQLGQAALRDNLVAEALDLVLVETLRTRPPRPIWEIDTTGRPAREVSQQIRTIARRWPPSRYGRIDWLSDPRVTEELLGRTP